MTFKLTLKLKNSGTCRHFNRTGREQSLHKRAWRKATPLILCWPLLSTRGHFVRLYFRLYWPIRAYWLNLMRLKDSGETSWKPLCRLLFCSRPKRRAWRMLFHNLEYWNSFTKKYIGTIEFDNVMQLNTQLLPWQRWGVLKRYTSCEVLDQSYETIFITCNVLQLKVAKWKQQDEVSYQKVLVKQDTAAAVTKVRDSRCPAAERCWGIQ